MRIVHAAAIAITSFPLPALAQDARFDALYDALGLPEVVEIMREEGFDYGGSLAETMLPGGGDPRWPAVLEQIYDTQMMNEELQGAMAEVLSGDDIDAILDFYTSDLGEKIVGLEVSARRALLEPEIEEASKEAATLQRLDETPRAALATEFIVANDLIESNVVGSLNSSYAFYMGLIDGGAMPAGVTAETAIEDIWAQEPEVRNDTTDWVYSFVLLAYQPLTDDELQQLIAFSRTDAGEELTDALFLAFDGLFEDISRGLGLGLARFMATQEL